MAFFRCCGRLFAVIHLLSCVLTVDRVLWLFGAFGSSGSFLLWRNRALNKFLRIFSPNSKLGSVLVCINVRNLLYSSDLRFQFLDFFNLDLYFFLRFLLAKDFIILKKIFMSQVFVDFQVLLSILQNVKFVVVSKGVHNVIEVSTFTEQKFCQDDDWIQVVNLRFFIFRRTLLLVFVKSIFLGCNETTFSSQNKVSDW